MDDWQLKPASDLGLSIDERAKSLKRESGLVQTMTHHLWWGAMRIYLKLWHRMVVENAHHLPRQPPFIVIANHSSHLDAMALAAQLSPLIRDRVFPIAAGDVFFHTPAIAFFAAWMLNALPMWRKSCGPHALEQLRERLVNEPCAYILFPEGARSRDGGLLPFKAGLGMIVAGTQVPVVPCYLHGCFQAMPADIKVPRPKQIRMRVGQPLVFADVPNERAGWHSIAERTQAAVQALGPPSAGHSDPDTGT